MNWKRGLTRLYFVLWASWLVFVVVRICLLSPSPQQLAAAATAAALAGLIAPAVLLLALRWVGSGFRSASS